MTTTRKQLRVAVAGLGTIAHTVHLPLLERRWDLFEVAAVCDLARSRVDKVGARYSVPHRRRYTDASAMLADGDFDAMLLLTSGPHGALAAHALGTGVPMLCEKPLAYTRAETAQLSGLADGSVSPRLMVGYMKQYDPAVVEAARLLADLGGAGAVHSVDIEVLHPSSTGQLAFANLPPSPTDVPADDAARLRERDDELVRAAVGVHPRAQQLYRILINSVAHDLSLLRLLTGSPETVDHAVTWPAEPPAGHEPSVEISGRLPTGGRYGIRWHYLPDYPTYRETVTLHHDGGSLRLVFASPYLLNAPTTLTVVAGRDGAEQRRVHRSVTEAFDEQLVAFHAMVTDGVSPLTGVAGGAEDVLTSQRVVRRFGDLSGVEIGGEAAGT